MARNRVIYQSEALFVSKDYNSTGLSDHTQLHRVQSANYGFTINRQDVNQFGNLARIDSLILEAPTVNFDISYYPTNGFNERALDFWVQNPSQLSEAQFASGHLANSTGQNFYILTVPEGRDANLNRVTGLNDNTIIGIGNAFLTDYTLDLSVGSLPTATASFEASNINSDASITGVSGVGFINIESPGIDPVAGTPVGFEVTLPYSTGNSHNGNFSADGQDTLSAIRPGDITLDLSAFDGQTFSTMDGSDQAIHIQSASLSLPLSRTPIERLGAKFPFARVVDFPVNASLTVNAIVNTTQAANLANLISGCDSNLKNVSLQLKECGGTTVGLNIDLKGCTIDSESFSSSVGSNKSVDLTFSTQIGGVRDLEKGIFVSGSNNTSLPWS